MQEAPGREVTVTTARAAGEVAAIYTYHGQPRRFRPQHKTHAALHFTFFSLLAYLGYEWLLTRIRSRKSIAVRHDRSSGLRGGKEGGQEGQVWESGGRRLNPWITKFTGPNQRRLSPPHPPEAKNERLEKQKK